MPESSFAKSESDSSQGIQNIVAVQLKTEKEKEREREKQRERERERERGCGIAAALLGKFCFVTEKRLYDHYRAVDCHNHH